MYNLTEQEIQELLEMGVDPSSIVSAYDQADLGTFVDDTFTPQGGTAFNLASGTGNSVFNTGSPLQVQQPLQQQNQVVQGSQPVINYTTTPSGAPSVTGPAPMPSQGGTAFNLNPAGGSSIFNSASRPFQINPKQSIMQKLKSGVETGFDKLEEKYKDKIVDKDGKPINYKPFDKTMQSLMGGVSYASGLNQAAQVQQQNRMANQSPFREAGNTKEYYNHDFVGENDPLFFLNSRDGAKAEPMYAANGVPIEAEGGEFYLDPTTGATLPIQGPSHEEGGVKMVAEPGSYIMSDNVKIPGSFVNDMLKKNALPPKKQYTISDVIRQFPQHFDTKGDAERLNDRSLDPIAKNSFEMNMRKKLANVSKLLAYQQQMNGGHGEDKGPEAKYGMEINGGAPLSFDYRPDELRVQDMQQMQQMPMADNGIKLPPRGVRAISGFEHTKGKADEVTGAPIPMPTSLTGGENYPLTGGNTNPQIWNQFTTFVNNTIGPETYNKLPEDVQTLLYNFAFVSGIDTPERQRRTLAGLAQAIGHATPGSNVPDGSDYRSKLSTNDAVNIIKGVKDFSKLNEIGNNYVNVQGPQLASIAYHPDNKIPAAYRETMTGRAIDVFNRYNTDNSGNPTTPPAQPTAATPNVNPASNSLDVRISPTKPGTIERSTDGGNTFTTIPNTPLDQPRIDAINQLVSQGKLTQDQGNILKQSTIKPDGSLSIPYSAQAAGIDQSTLAQAASYLGNRYVGFSNVPENVKTIYGQNVSMVPGSRKEEYFDKVSNKTFSSLEEYNKFKQENPKLYEDYGKSLEHYTTQKEYYGDKMNTPEEAVNILKKYDKDGNINNFVLDPSKVKGEDGKPDPEKLDELVKAFNSLQGTGTDGKKKFQYKDQKGKIHNIVQNSTPGLKGQFYAGLDPDMAAAYYVYKTYGKGVYDQNKADPTALKNIWGKEAIGLNEEDLKSDAWTSGKFFNATWAKKNEATMPAGLRAALGNDNKFGMDHMDPRYQKSLNIDPEKRITPGFGETQIEAEIPDTPGDKPKKNPPYKERLPLGQYMGLLPSPRTQNYLPEYRQERYEPNLVSLRSAKNDQVAAMNSMLQQQGMNPATMAARQASLYGEAAKNIGAITEQENNTNAQILNQAKAQNAQMANQIQGLQQQANRQYVTENAQDLAALDADRYKKLSDLYTAQQKVNQYNAQLNFLDKHAGPNYDYGMDKEGNITLTRNDKKVDYDPSLAAATAKTQGLASSVESSKTTNTNTTTPEKKEENANTTTTKRLGGKNKNYRMLY